MVTSSYKQAQQYKAGPSVVAGFLHRGRATHKRRSRQCQSLAQVATLTERLRQLEAEVERLNSRPEGLPSDPPLPRHGYGPRLIALCVNLTQRNGLRPTLDVLSPGLGSPIPTKPASHLHWLLKETRLTYKLCDSPKRT